jgi:tryptophan synthase alpha chain
LSVIRGITKKPIAVGFGVSTPEEARRVSEYADGVIIGSAIVKKLYELPEGLGEFQPR